MPNGGVDTVVFKSPSLRDVVDQNGEVNGRLMHTANFVNLTNVLNHYDRINLFPQVPGIADAIDDRLLPNGNPQDLNMTNQERNRVIAFLRTLTGSDVYTNEQWSDPFDENGNLEILNSPIVTSTGNVEQIEFNIYPNPVFEILNVTGDLDNKTIEIYNQQHLIQSVKSENKNLQIPFNQFNTGIYFIIVRDQDNQIIMVKKVLKY